MSYGDERRYGNQQSFGNRNGSGGGFQKKADKPDLTFAPQSLEFKFYDEKGYIQEKLFDETANNIAKTFIGRDSNGKPDHVSSTQLRKFFDELKSFEKYFVSIEESKWEEKKPYIKMMKSKIAYAIARKGATKGVYKNLEKFIIDGINQVNKEKDYFTFLSLFEAVCGFYCQILLDNNFKLND